MTRHCSRGRYYVQLDSLNDDEVAGLLDDAVDRSRGLAGDFALAMMRVRTWYRMRADDARRSLTALRSRRWCRPRTGRAGTRPCRSAAPRRQRSPRRRYVTTSQQPALRRHHALVGQFEDDVDAALRYLRHTRGGGGPPLHRSSNPSSAPARTSVWRTRRRCDGVARCTHRQIGVPEARSFSPRQIVHDALAPKSNTAYRHDHDRRRAVRPRGSSTTSPSWLGYAGAAALGHGDGYRYTHDSRAGWAPNSSSRTI